MAKSKKLEATPIHPMNQPQTNHISDEECLYHYKMIIMDQLANYLNDETVQKSILDSITIVDHEIRIAVNFKSETPIQQVRDILIAEQQLVLDNIVEDGPTPTIE